MFKAQFVTSEAHNHFVTEFHFLLRDLKQEISNLQVKTDELQCSYDQLVKLYNTELKQYKACVAAYRKLTTILLEIPDFKEKWDKFHEAQDYDMR